MSLPLATRLRLRARQALSEGLRLLPDRTVEHWRKRYASASGLRRRIWRPVVSTLRHRPFGSRQDFALPDNPAVRLTAVESRLARLLYWYGEKGYEGSETWWWRRFCEMSRSILELGANIGYYTVQGALAAPRARYVAVEANPESAEVIRANLALNRIDHVELIQAAVVDGRDSASVELALPDQERYVAPSGAYLLDGAEGMTHRPASRTITVPAVAMASLISDVDLIKLDIEGYEARVLSSVRDTLLAARPTIVLEVLRHARQLRSVILDLHDNGYLVFAIGDTTLHLLSRSALASPRPLPRYGSRDVILVPSERARWL